ncbi:MAG: hypothetical protein RIF41_00045, partial [Polyangiaceae bacterium]
AQQRKRGATREREQLQNVARDIQTTLQNCLARAKAPLTNKCVHQIRGLTRSELERAKGEIEKGLERELGRIDQEIQRQRADNHIRLERLLLEHDLPESRQWVDYRVTPDGATSADLIGVSSSKLSWAIELEIPSEHVLHEPLRVDRLFPQLAIEIPEMAGWVRKRMKLKSYKLTKDYIVALQHQEGRAVLELRTSVQERDTGFDITFVGGVPRQIVRLNKGAASDPSEPEVADIPKLEELYKTIAKGLAELRNNRRALKSARLDDKPVGRHKQPSVLVERLVRQMAPVVQLISQHSLSPTELVLKRVLADDQRVEIFASKAELNAKVETLTPGSRQLFEALELDQPNPVPSMTPPPVQARPSKPEGSESKKSKDAQPGASEAKLEGAKPAGAPSKDAKQGPTIPGPPKNPSDAVPGAKKSGGEASGDDPSKAARSVPPVPSPPPSAKSSGPPPVPKRDPKPSDHAATNLPGLFSDFDDEDVKSVADEVSIPSASQPVAAISLTRKTTRNTYPGVGARPPAPPLPDEASSPDIDVDVDENVEVAIRDENTDVMDDVDALLERQLGDGKDAPPDSEPPQPTKVRPPFKATPPKTPPAGSTAPGPGSVIPKPSTPSRRVPPPPPKRDEIESLHSGDFKMEDIED